MGRHLEHILSRIELEKLLDKLSSHPDPDPDLEQYTTPTRVAAEMLFTATYVFDDIRNKIVVDLGCGTGKLGIGALFLGAHRVIGIDIDIKAIKMGVENTELSNLQYKLEWVAGDVSLLQGSFDTVIMNPPFGTRQRHLDIKFLSEAMKISKCIYSIHKSTTRRFLIDFIHLHGGKISFLAQLNLEIPWMFNFHSKASRSLKVDVYRIEIINQRVY